MRVYDSHGTLVQEWTSSPDIAKNENVGWWMRRRRMAFTCAGYRSQITLRRSPKDGREDFDWFRIGFFLNEDGPCLCK